MHLRFKRKYKFVWVSVEINRACIRVPCSEIAHLHTRVGGEVQDAEYRVQSTKSKGDSKFYNKVQGTE